MPKFESNEPQRAREEARPSSQTVNVKVTHSSENIKGIAIIDGAGVVHRFAVPAGAKDWLTIRGAIATGIFDEMYWETGQPDVVEMTDEELAGVKRSSFLPVPNEPTVYPAYIPGPDDPRYEDGKAGRYLLEEGGVIGGSVN